MKEILDGTDLIISVGDTALAFSTGCKITITTETGERLTKEAANGKWKEKYVKSHSSDITADGLQLLNNNDDLPAYDQLLAMMTNDEPVTVHYGVRKEDSREVNKANGYTGKYYITSLELDGQTGDDAKYSVKLENNGAITKVGGGIAGEV